MCGTAREARLYFPNLSNIQFVSLQDTDDVVGSPFEVRHIQANQFFVLANLGLLPEGHLPVVDFNRTILGADEADV